MNFEIWTRLERADLFLALGQNRQGWRLHSASCRFLETAGAGVERGQRASGVDADQPITFRARQRGIGQWLHFLVRTGDVRMPSRIASGVIDWSHRRRVRFFRSARIAVCCEKSTRPRGPASQALMISINVCPFDQFLEQLQSPLVLLDRRKIEMIRQHREILQVPFASFYLRAFGRHNLDQVTDGRGDHVSIVLIIILLVLEFAQSLGQIAGPRSVFRR